MHLKQEKKKQKERTTLLQEQPIRILWSHEFVGNRSVCKLDHQDLATHLLAIVTHNGLLSQKLVGICDKATTTAETIGAPQNIQLQNLSNC